MCLNEVTAIKESYETLRMEVAEIAKDREMEEGAVKAALMQCSAVYRRACGTESEDDSKLNFTDSELEQANQVIVGLAMYSEDPHLQFKAATYIRDDKKGRKEVVKQVHGQQFNILMFNEQMAKIRDVAGRAKDRVLGGNGHSNSKLIEA